MNTQKKISDWLNSGEYQVELENALTKIIRKADSSKNESETANAFETEIYFQIRSKLGIELSIKKEVKLNSIKHKFELRNRKSGRGRLDAVINNLVIEYKHHNKLNNERQRREAYSQVEDYLTALYKKENVQYDAILTDGIRIAYFQMSSNHKIYSTKLRTLKKLDLDKIIKAILNNEYKKFDSDNIVNDFFISPSSNSSSKKLAKTLFNVLVNHPTPKTSMLYSEWENLMHLSLDDNGKSQDIEKRRNDLSKIFSITINSNESEFKAIYALQTTYAIIVKLIACRAVDFVNFNDKVNTYHDLTALNSTSAQAFFQKMEDGYSYKMGVQNFLEGDFFSWYSDEKQWNDAIFNHINGILELVDTYSTFSFNIKFEPIDVFKDLYMSIIPQSIRHSMGEYFTPEWLADYVVNNTIKLYKKGDWKAVDPCCGSGIFLVTQDGQRTVGRCSTHHVAHLFRCTVIRCHVTTVDRHLYTILRLSHGIRQVDGDFSRKLIVLQLVFLIREILGCGLCRFSRHRVEADVKRGQFARYSRTAVATRRITAVAGHVTIIPTVAAVVFTFRKRIVL